MIEYRVTEKSQGLLFRVGQQPFSLWNLFPRSATPGKHGAALYMGSVPGS